jgi:hypothetical protein
VPCTFHSVLRTKALRVIPLCAPCGASTVRCLLFTLSRPHLPTSGSHTILAARTLKHPHRLNDSIAYLVEALSRAARVAGISCGGSVSPSFQMLDGETRACAASAVRVCMGAAVSAAAAAQISGARKCRAIVQRGHVRVRSAVEGEKARDEEAKRKRMGAPRARALA